MKMTEIRTDALTPEEIARYNDQGFLLPIRVLDDDGKAAALVHGVDQGCGIAELSVGARVGDDRAGQVTFGQSVTQVGLEADGSAAGRNDLIPQRVGAGTGGVVVNGQGHALVGQRRRHRAAQPPAGAGDQGHTALELHQCFPAATGEIGRIWPLVVESELASDITPSVISCSST